MSSMEPTPFQSGHQLTAEEVQWLRDFMQAMKRGVSTTGDIRASMDSTGLSIDSGPHYPELLELSGDEAASRVTYVPVERDGTLATPEVEIDTLAD